MMIFNFKKKIKIMYTSILEIGEFDFFAVEANLCVVWEFKGIASE